MMAVNGAVRNVLVAVVVVLLAGGGYFAGYRHGYNGGQQVAQAMTADWQQRIEVLQQARQQGERQRGDDLDEVARRLAVLQSDFMRLESVGRRLLYQSGVQRGEVNQRLPLGQGGPEQPVAAAADKASLLASMASLEQRMQESEHAFERLEVHYLALTERALARGYPQGYPVRSGWLSSEFGVRADPFTGQLAYHNGVDFAGKQGSDVIAVAAGTVIRAGSYKGYGQLVEMDHGNGYITRYGHNSQVHVVVGQRVAKGQRLAAMGSSGRSTGPHVHFEVLYGGRYVDPMRFISSAG